MGSQHPLNSKTGGVRSPTIRKLAKDGTTWTPTEQRTRDRCLRQFCNAGRKGVEVSSGNSDAYKRGWDIAFGTPEQKARALAETEAEKNGGFVEDGMVFERVSPEEARDLEVRPRWGLTATITGIDP